MDYRISAEERSRFKRCRRQWDFASPHRRDLEPTDAAFSAVPIAIEDALAVYYFPGMWDWPAETVLPLVRKGFHRAMTERSGSQAEVEAGATVLERYLAWAPTVDEFAPIKIAHDVEGLVPHPSQPDRGLVTPEGRRITYTDRVDLLAIDADDAYWVVRHLVVDQWQDLNALLLDEVAVASCWAWEQTYLGMEIAGTIHNEIRLGAAPQDEPAPDLPHGRASRGTVAQHDPSGGGRSIPQHRRLYTRGGGLTAVEGIQQRVAGPVRRTRIRRTPEEIQGMARRISAEAIEMTDPEIEVYPNPAEHCARCAFVAPCVALTKGHDPASATGYRKRPAGAGGLTPRLGGETWSFGRGAAPWTR
jgi:hypothetical protein